MNLAAVQTADINQADFNIRLPTDGEPHLSVGGSAKQFQSDEIHFLLICIQHVKLGSPCTPPDSCRLLQLCKRRDSFVSFSEMISTCVKQLFHRYELLSTTWEHGTGECCPGTPPSPLWALKLPQRWPKGCSCTVGKASSHRCSLYDWHSVASHLIRLNAHLWQHPWGTHVLWQTLNCP